MSGLINYHGLEIPGAVPGAGNTAIAENFQDLVNWHPQSQWAQTGNPTADDDQTQNYYPGSLWLNSATNELFLCMSSATGAAEWEQVILASQANEPNGYLQINSNGGISYGNNVTETPQYAFSIGSNMNVGVIPGECSFAIGDGCTSTGQYSIAIGYNNDAMSGSSVAIGYSNSAASAFSVAIGDSNEVHGINSFGIGWRNQSSGSYSIVMGSGNYVSGYNAVAMGSGNTASGILSFAMGLGASASGNNAVAIGLSNNASGSYSVALGAYSNSLLYGQNSFASGKFEYQGDAQTVLFVVRNTTTNTTATDLFLDGSSAVMTLPVNQTAWRFTADVAAYDSTTNLSGAWEIKGCVKRNNSGTYSLVGTPTTSSWLDSSFTGIATVTASSGFQVQVTGISTDTIRWVAKVTVVQVSFGEP